MGGLCRTGDWRQSVLTTTKVSNGRKTCVFQLAWPLHSSCVGGAAALELCWWCSSPSLARPQLTCVCRSVEPRASMAGWSKPTVQPTSTTPNTKLRPQSTCNRLRDLCSRVAHPQFREARPMQGSQQKIGRRPSDQSRLRFARLGGRPGTATSTIRQACFNPFDTWQPKARRAPDRSALVPSTAVSI